MGGIVFHNNSSNSTTIMYWLILGVCLTPYYTIRHTDTNQMLPFTQFQECRFQNLIIQKLL